MKKLSFLVNCNKICNLTDKNILYVRKVRRLVIKNLKISFIDGNRDDTFVGKIDTFGFSLVGVPKDKIAQACNSSLISQQGVYFLVNTNEAKTDRRYIYVGQTKNGPHRLIDHNTKKHEWNLAYMFLGDKNIFPLQVVDELEAFEIDKYQNNVAFNCVNSKPNKAQASDETLDVAKIIEDVLTFFGYGSDASLNIYTNAHGAHVKSSFQVPSSHEENNNTNSDNNEDNSSGNENLPHSTKPYITSEQIISYRFLNHTYPFTTGKDMLINICTILYSSKTSGFKTLAKNDFCFKGSKKPLISSNKNNLRVPGEILHSRIYIETNLSVQRIINIIYKLIQQLGYTNKDFEVVYK